MSNNTIIMSKLRHILRLHAQRKGTNEISKQTGVARNTVKKYIAKYKCKLPNIYFNSAIN